MQFQAIFTILAAAASVSASQLRTRQAAAGCGNGQVLACCNSKGDSSASGSLLGGALSNVLGGNCDQLPINIIGANGLVDHACGSNQASCCTGDMNGLVNVACNPISL